MCQERMHIPMFTCVPSRLADLINVVVLTDLFSGARNREHPVPHQRNTL